MPWVRIVIPIVIILYLIASGWNIDSDNIKIKVGPAEITLRPPTSAQESISSPAVTPSVTTLSNTLIYHAPIITRVNEREEYVNNELKVYKDIYFFDAGGDAISVIYEIVFMTTPSNPSKSTPIRSFKEQQKAGTYTTEAWYCGRRSRIYTVILKARIIDAAGSESHPFNITFNCH